MGRRRHHRRAAVCSAWAAKLQRQHPRWLLRQRRASRRHCRSAAAAVACGARAHAATAPLPQRSPAYNCALQAAAAAALVGLQFIARLRPIVLQFRGVSHSSYLAATDLVNDLLSPFKVTVLFLRLLSKQTPVTCSRTRQCLDFWNWVLTRISFLTKRQEATHVSPIIGPHTWYRLGWVHIPMGQLG